MARADRRGGVVDHQGQAALNGDTIVALSSGAPPAAIAIIRISGPQAFAAVCQLAGSIPPPRCAALRAIRDDGGALLDRALVLAFPAATSATGEDLVELHCHGGRAVVAAVHRAALACQGVRAAEPGEFTRRSLLNGRVDLAQAQGLADLLTAETEAERRMAIGAAEGVVGRAIRGWMDRLDDLAAQVEASIDFAEEGDVVAEAASLATIDAGRAALAAEIATVLAAPPVERWRDGWRVVIAGPPNAGKSTLLNLLSQRDAAIVSEVAGTTRDRIEATVQHEGIGFVLIDTAGLREASDDAIELVGIDRARQSMETADLVLWLGDDAPPPGGRVIWVHARADLPGRGDPPVGAIAVTQNERCTVAALWHSIVEATGGRAPPLPLHANEQEHCRHAVGYLEERADDIVLLAECLRHARQELGATIGEDATERLLDRIFSRFCLGK